MRAIQKLLDNALRRYDDSDAETRLKARLFFYLCLAILVLIPMAVAYTSFLDCNNPDMGYAVNMKIVIPEVVAFLLVFFVLILFMLGYFTASANMVLIILFSAIWTVMIFEQTSAVARLDTIALVYAIMSMTPLFFLRKGYPIIIYGVANIALLLAFSFTFRSQFNITENAFIDYIGDNVTSLLLLTATAFSIFTINRKALDTAEKGLAERKIAEQSLMRTQENLRETLEATTDGIWTWNSTTNELSYSPRFYVMLGYAPGEFPPTLASLKNLAHPDDLERALAVRNEFLKTWPPVYKNEYRLRAKSGEYRWISEQGRIVDYDEQKKPAKMIGSLQDITERKMAEERLTQSIHEKEFLIKEMHHRVKNNMQVVSSLLSLQSRKVDDPKYLDFFIESQNRIQAMALVHEKLYHADDLEKIDFSRYLNELTQHLFNSYNINKHKVGLKLDVKEIYFDIDTAVPCGMIINELVTNSLKYAFPGDRSGEISVTILKNAEKKHVLTVSDNGMGFPAGIDTRALNTLGLQIVHSLTRQIRGTIEITTNSGAKFEITF
jgi:PAS domain S-box-containing protein